MKLKTITYIDDIDFIMEDVFLILKKMKCYNVINVFWNNDVDVEYHCYRVGNTSFSWDIIWGGFIEIIVKEVGIETTYIFTYEELAAL